MARRLQTPAMDDPAEAGACPSRRALLGSVGAGAAAGLAGCAGALDGGDGDDGDAPGDRWEEGGPPDREGWSVAFADDFTGADLDRSVWSSGFGEYPLDCPHFAGPDHCTVPENVDVEDDRLVLTATEDTPTIPVEERFEDRSDQPDFSVGAVNTEGAFEQEFGYFEAKTRAEVGPGTLPGFWLFLNRGEHDHREINVEFYGREPGELVDFGVVWQPHGDGELEHSSHEYSLATPTDERFHVWGIEWGPEHVAFDVDGERVLTVDEPAMAEHMPGAGLYVVLQHGVFDAADWIGDSAEADFPLRHEVEWVRVWQREEWSS